MRREGRARLEAEGVRPYRWHDKLIIRGGFVFGVCLLIWGDGVDRIFGIGLTAPIVVLWCWAAFVVARKALRERRAARRS